jgi:hypothetical protein
VDVRLAKHDDVHDVMELETRNYVGNLAPAERSHGYISILHPRAWFDAAVDAGGLHVAVDDSGAVVGFIAVTEPPAPQEAAASPIMRAMLECVETIELDGNPIAAQRFAVRGPVLIDRSARGAGLYAAFNAVTSRAYRERFDVGVLFVAADNPRSFRTTTTKLGAKPVAQFEVDSLYYNLLAFHF